MSAVFCFFFFLLAERREGFDTDCAGIIFGIIRHYEHNFHPAFSEKSTASIIFTFDQFFSTKLSFIDHATFLDRDQCYREI